MIKHIVMFKLKEANFTENILRLKKKLDLLKSKIPQLKHLETGINISDSPSAYDFVLISDFEDEESLDVYRKHPAHQEVVILIKKITDNVKVVDYKL